MQTKSRDVLERDFSWDGGHLEGCSTVDRKDWACLVKGLERNGIDGSENMNKGTAKVSTLMDNLKGYEICTWYQQRKTAWGYSGQQIPVSLPVPFRLQYFSV